MDNWSKNFRAYFGKLSGFLDLLARYGTPKELEKLAQQPEFQQWAESVARGMATNAYRSNALSWRDAAAKSGRGRLLFENLQKELAGTNVGSAVAGIVRENAELISSLPIDLAEKLTAYVNKRRIEGVRSKQIQTEVRNWLPNIAASRIRLICRTETSKSESALTAARSQDLGIEWYQWLDANDQRVRKSHRFMSKVLCRFDDPPAPEELIGINSTLGHYGAGMCPNCRCLMASLISLDEIDWPARVYANGSVRRFTRVQFSRLLTKKAA